jgi:beta-lactam-binding protein with PASTA domain
MPADGTLSSWSKVKIVLPFARAGRVPDVVGLSLEQARHRLAKRKLAGTIAYGDGAPAGTVLAQFPKAGRAAVPNMTIRLIVARG